MGCIMRLIDDYGCPVGYLQDFDFEAHEGVGEIALTKERSEAMEFPDLLAALTYRARSPICKPLRDDGQPNRPMTATNWEFITTSIDEPEGTV